MSLTNLQEVGRKNRSIPRLASLPSVHQEGFHASYKERPHGMQLTGVTRFLNIRIKLYGVFRSAANANELRLEVGNKPATVRSVVSQLISQDRYEALKQLLLDRETSDPRPNALIMVSGREINTLKGLDTELTETDELALLPVAHGG